jgi:hypothetical protein
VSNEDGNFNTANGANALFFNTAGSLNTANGVSALLHNTTGDFNTANGVDALSSNTAGDNNTANGVSALSSNNIGHDNTANGANALGSNSTGNFNTACGRDALLNNISGSGNVALGVLAGTGVSTADGVICIGATGLNVPNSCFIGNIFGVTSSGGTGVFVNRAGQLGTATSSRRFKDGIKPMAQASEALFALKPVTFHYKKELDPQGIPQFGLVAEDVEKVNPDLVSATLKAKLIRCATRR